MTPNTMKKTLLLATLVAGLSPYAAADTGDELVAARAAWRQKDAATLARTVEATRGDELSAYPRYWQALLALENGDDAPARAFLAAEPASTLTERLTGEWLKRLGKDNDWAAFAREIRRVPADERDTETACYATLAELKAGQKAQPDADLLDNLKLPDGCNALLNEAARQGTLSADEVRSRVRSLVAINYVTVARGLASAAGLSEEFFTPSSNEAAVIAVVRQGKSDLSGAAAELTRLAPSLTAEQSAFGWGQLALLAARKQDAGNALIWFSRALPSELTPEQWEWWARAALRAEDWNTVLAVTSKMPAKLAAKGAWRYWRARAELALGQRAQGQARLVQLSSEHNYYGILARETLGSSISAPPAPLSASDADIARAGAEPAVRRASLLFDYAREKGEPALLEEGRREWRWAMRGKDDKALIAAAEYGRARGYYDMAIYSAERTRNQHNFGLRFLTPYRDATRRYAAQLEVDPAWIYGLMRQESRFVTVARSGVGAQGLMQLMPATARWVATKVGMDSFDVNDVDTNIHLGTWYLRHVLDTTGHPVLATAGYNAGPGRARAWRDSRPLEGAIYAETIPFTETRDYVQKVMANAVEYAAQSGEGETSLTGRMGTIAAK